MSTARIRYVGLKQEETAFRDATGITWTPGAVEAVDVRHVAAMLKHPDVFALAEEAIGGLADAKPKTQADTPESPLDALSREDLHKLAKARGVKVHHTSGAAAVKAALLAAPTAG